MGTAARSKLSGPALKTVLCLLGVSLLCGAGAAYAADGQAAASPIEEHTLPTPFSYPIDLAIDSMGRVWYTAENSHKVGFFDDKDKKFREFDLPRGSSPSGIVIDKGGTVWFTLSSGSANAIGSLSPETGKVEVRRVPSKNAEPYMIAVSKDGSVWFTERNANKIGVFNGKGFREYPILTPNSQPAGIAVDSKGIVWFSESVGNNIGAIDLVKGVIKEYRIPTAYANPSDLVVDAKDRVWFVEMNGNRVCMFDPAVAMFNEAIIPTLNSVPVRLSVSADGVVWFTENRGNKVASFDPTSAAFTEYPIPTPTSLPVGVAAGAGKVWFTESARDANKISSIRTSGGAASTENGRSR